MSCGIAFGRSLRRFRGSGVRCQTTCSITSSAAGAEETKCGLLTAERVDAETEAASPMVRRENTCEELAPRFLIAGERSHSERELFMSSVPVTTS